MADKKIKKTIPVLGMSCASCAISVESMLKSTEGVNDAAVSYANKSIVVDYNEDKTDLFKLQKVVQAIGYDLVISEEADKIVIEKEKVRFKELRWRLILATSLTLPVFVISMFLMGTIAYQPWFLLLLTLPVVFISGQEFFINAARKARHFTANMDTLVAMGTGITFVFSAFNTIYPQFFIKRGLEPHIYFESAAVIITLILLGRFLEERSKASASAALKKLIGLQPKTMIVIRNGNEMHIGLKEVNPGDIVLIKPGEKIPVDGTILAGSTYINESMITGESLPVFRKEDEQVFAGTINQQGSIKIKAEKLGSETLLSQIIQMVQEAQASTPPIQRLVDKAAAVFVPIVLFIAAGTFFLWYFLGPAPSSTFAFLTLISVLIIACPCALGLATPTALTVGVGKGAENGILIRNSEALEIIHKMDILVVDKTGTLTKGEPVVSEIYWINDKKAKELAAILTAIEKLAEHPLAKAITEYFNNKTNSNDIKEFENIPGQGIKAFINGVHYWTGSEKFCEEYQVGITEKVSEKIKQYKKQAKTIVYFGSQNDLLAVIAVSDELRDGAKQTIMYLKDIGIETIMLTGDHEASASYIAAEAGITNVHAGMLPENKSQYIKELQMQGKIVGMAGDGINDAIALAQADVGIAMAKGSDIAMESAGITLMKSDLQHISAAIKLSKATVKKIRQNLFWAFIYNVIAIPVAAGALFPAFGFLLNPMIAGGAMAMSSVSVITNSLRLRKVKI